MRVSIPHSSNGSFTKKSFLKVSLTLFWYDTRIGVNKTLLHGEDERGK